LLLVVLLALLLCQYHRDSIVTSRNIIKLNEKLRKFVEPPRSYEQLEEQTKIMTALVALENEQYFLKFLTYAHSCPPEGINDRIAELIVISKNPSIMKTFNRWVDNAFKTGIHNDVINYAPLIYSRKCPQELIGFYERLSKNDPDWYIQPYKFNAETLVDVKVSKMKGLNLKKAKDYYQAIKECPSEYAISLMK